MKPQQRRRETRSAHLSCERVLAATLWLAVASVVGGCTQQLAAAPVAPGKNSSPPVGSIEPPSKALARIEQLIGTAACELDSQCRVAGIGQRPCGGAESHRAWSTATTTTKDLEEPLLAYAQERLRWHEKVGVMSTCEIRPEPAARCERPGAGQQAGRCALIGSSSGLR